MLNNPAMPSSDGTPTSAYIVTPKGVVKMETTNMSKADLDAISLQLCQLMATQTDVQPAAQNASAVDSSVTETPSPEVNNIPQSVPQTTADNAHRAAEFIAENDNFVAAMPVNHKDRASSDDSAKFVPSHNNEATDTASKTKSNKENKNISLFDGVDDNTPVVNESVDLASMGITFDDKQPMSKPNVSVMTDDANQQSSGSMLFPLDGYTANKPASFTQPTSDVPDSAVSTATPDDDDDDDGIADYIRSTGYISNNNLWRRWIMAQMLRHYNKADGTSGFDEYFVTGTPYFYQWKVALSELKVLSHLAKKNPNELAKRERFFNSDVVNHMASDYLKKLTTFISKAEKKRDSNFKHVSAADRKRCMYVDIPGFKKRVYLEPNPLAPNSHNKRGYTTVKELTDMVSRLSYKITKSNTYYQQQKAVEIFMKNCPLVKTFAKDSAWKNAFKGSGAYYTMDNMIKFHDCGFFINGQKLPMTESLKYLEQKTTEYFGEYYRLYALMRQFVSDNNFQYSDVPIDDYNLPNYDG